MKPISALVLSLLAGIATFAAQHSLFPPKLHAAPYVVPNGPGWRQEMLAQDRGEVGVDQTLSRLVDRLDLSPEQTNAFRPILHQEHERILALLLTAPRTLSRDQFVAEQHEVAASAHRQLDQLLTPEQLELVKQRRGAATS
jgi:hypothetical protein